MKGFLYNKGNGRTEFRRGLVTYQDSIYIIGNDTLNINTAFTGSFIRNQFSAAQSSSNFWISGNGRVNGELGIGISSDLGNYKLQMITPSSGNGILVDGSTNGGTGYHFKGKDQAYAWIAENGIAQVSLQNVLSGSAWSLDAVNTSFSIVGRSADVTIGTDAFADVYLSPGRKLKVNLGSDATGDMYYRNASGDFSRLPVGFNGNVLTLASGVPSWTSVTGSAWGLNGNTGTNPTTNFIGTTHFQNLVFKTSNTNRAIITASGNVGINTINPSAMLDVYNGNARINGTYNYSYDGSPLTVIDSSNDRSQYTLGFWKLPNMPDNTRLTLQFGKNSNTNNSAFIAFAKLSDGSSSNYIEFQLAGKGNLLNIHGNRNIDIGKTTPTTLLTDDGYRLNVIVEDGNIAANTRVINGTTQGATYNTTSAARTAYSGYFNTNGTRTTGSNNLTNVGLFTTASGGQVNYAFMSDGNHNYANLPSSSDTSYKPLGINSSGDVAKINTWQADLSNSESFLGSDLSLTANTFSDVASVSLSAGTWLISGNVTVESPDNTAQRVTYKLWDGATVNQAGEASSAAMGASTKGYLSAPVSAVVVLSSTTTIKVSVASTVASTVKTTPVDNNSGTTNKASSIRAVKIKY